MSAINHRSSKRRRRRPPSQFHAVTAAEERFLQAAIQNSKLDKARPANGKLSVPEGPVFFPTVEDFEGNPVAYVEKIRAQAEPWGICKIVPPEGWNPAPYFAADMHSKKRFSTKLQMLHRLQEGVSFGDGVEYTIDEYQTVASQRTKQWKEQNYPHHDLMSRHCESLEQEQKAAAAAARSTGVKKENGSTTPPVTTTAPPLHGAAEKRFIPENLERDYWQIVETHTQQLAVEYGNDIDTAVFGSGFPLSERGRSINGTDHKKHETTEPAFGTHEYYKETWWNLNNIPCAPDSILRHVKVGINGINVPWLYFGSLFTTFCWHNEDNYLYSINYHHMGAPKQWYGVAGTKESAEGLEKVFRSYLSMKMRDVPDLLHHITTMFSPRLLQNANVPVCKLIQYEGEFVVTFPRSFHGGFSYGPNVGEAVNFAPHDWIAYGADANERYRSFARPAVFSHDRLTFTMARHYKELKNYATCKSLWEELERVVAEETSLRQKLTETGVRNVSHLISLPKNTLDQLDENSANYDDKRLCHACKHVCFFSAVACECSQSKVSCLRHSHYMCRCPTERKYFMIWSPDEELKETLDRVRRHCEYLKGKEESEGRSTDTDKDVENAWQPPKVAPGVMQDLALHKNDEICTDPVRAETFWKPKKVQDRSFICGSTPMDLKVEQTRTNSPSSSASKPARAVSISSEASAATDDDEEIEIVEVRPPTV